MYKKTRYQTVDFNILNGTSSLLLRETMLEGHIFAAAIHVEGNLPNQIINFGIKTNGGNDIVDPSTLRDWQQRSGGNYIDSMKPLDIKGGQTLILKFHSLTNLAADLKGQIVFVIHQNCND